jgi:YfiH family protein
MKFIQPSWPAPKHIKSYTTLRSGWGGRKPHHEENRGNYSGNHPQYVEESKRLETLLQLPDEPLWITQTHSTIVIEATPENREQNADASFTSQPNRICVVLTADCLPILITNKQGTSVAAIHAGWRGLSSGIIEKTLQALQQPAEDLLVWLGPAIGPQKFEVGKDVYDEFTGRHAESIAAFKPHAEGKWLANLYELAKIRLNLQGINQIYGGDYCTFTQDEMFFSYRRDQGKTGRMATLIWIDDQIP